MFCLVLLADVSLKKTEFQVSLQPRRNAEGAEVVCLKF